MMKRLTALLLALVLILSACGRGGDEDDAETDGGTESGDTETGDAGTITPADYAYRADMITLPEEFSYVDHFTVYGDRIYLTYIEYEDMVGYVCSVDMAGEDLQKREIPIERSTGYFTGLDSDGDGNIWACLQEYDATYDEDAGTSEMTDYRTTLIQLDSDLNPVSSHELEELEESPNVQHMAVDGSGYIYLLTSLGSWDSETSAVLVYDGDGTLQFRAEHDQWAYSLVNISGSIYLYGWGDAIHPVEPDTGTIGDEVPLDTYGNVYSALNGRLYYGADSSLYSREPDGTAIRQELTWVDVDIASSDVDSLLVLEDGSILCAVNGGEAPAQLALLTPIDESEVTERQELTLATLYAGQALEAAVVRFNGENDEYRIVLNDYSQYNTEDDLTAGEQRLNADLLTGQVPDLIDLSSVQTDLLVARGLLADLYPLLDADSELDRSDFVPSVLSALERDGSLYELATHFSILTLVGSAEEVGAYTDWTVEEFLDYADTLPEGVTAMAPTTDRSSLLQILVAVNQSRLIDWETGACHFDEDWFIGLLEYCATYRSAEDIDDSEYEQETPERIVAGTQKLEMLNISDLDELQLYQGMFGDLAFVGYPTDEGSSNPIVLTNSIGISSTTEHTEAAWSFIRLYMTTDLGYSWALPAIQADFDDLIDEAINGDSTGTWTWGSLEVELGSMSQEDADTVRDLVESADSVYRYDEAIWTIIEEEAEAFFAGDKTAQEAAALMTNRTQTYIQEQF